MKLCRRFIHFVRQIASPKQYRKAISRTTYQKNATANGRASASGAAYHLNERQPEVPVDTHVFRTARRLGLIGPKVTADQAHAVFAKMTPPAWVYPLHVNLIRHGRHICHAQRPECTKCTLYSECAFVGSVNPQETAAVE